MIRLVIISALLVVAAQAASDPNKGGATGGVQNAGAKNDVDDAANGPNGKACGKGATVDSIKGDGQFVCNCAGTKMTGDNCEKLAGPSVGGVKPKPGSSADGGKQIGSTKDAEMAVRVAKQLAKATESSFCTGKGAGDKCARTSDGKVTHECASVPLASVFKSGSRILTAANGAIATAQKDGLNGPKEGEITCTCNPGCTNGKICDPGVAQSNCQCVCQSSNPEDCEPGGRDHEATEVATAGAGGGDRLRRQDKLGESSTTEGGKNDVLGTSDAEDDADCCTPDPCGANEACMTTATAGECECWEPGATFGFSILEGSKATGAATLQCKAISAPHRPVTADWASKLSLCESKKPGQSCASDGECKRVLNSAIGRESSILSKANTAVAQEDKPNGPKEGETHCSCNPPCTNGKYCDPGVSQSNCQCVCQSSNPEDCEPGGKDAGFSTAVAGGGDRRRRQLGKPGSVSDSDSSTAAGVDDCCTPDPCADDEACMTTSSAGVCECWKGANTEVDLGSKLSGTQLGGGASLSSSGLLGGFLGRGSNLENDKVSSLQCRRTPSQTSKQIWMTRCTSVYEDGCDAKDCSSCSFVDAEDDAAVVKAQQYCSNQCSAGKKLEEARVELTTARGTDGKLESNIMKGAGNIETFLGSMGFASDRDGKKQASDLVTKFVGAQNLEISALRDALSACGVVHAQEGENGPKEGETHCTCNPGCTNGKICDPGVAQSNCQCVCQSDDPKDCEPGGKDHAGTEVATAGEGGGDRLRRAFDKAALQKWSKEAACTDDETKELSSALADSELRLQSASSLASLLSDESPVDQSAAAVATVALSVATMAAAASFVW